MAAKVVQISETTKFQMSYNVKKLRKPLRPFAGFHIILYFCTYMKKMIISLMGLLVFAIAASAQEENQIPDEVTFLLRKCAEAMSHPDGVEYEMTIKAKYTVITVMKGQINAFAKDNKNKFFLTMRILDQHTKSAGGFDGVRQWKYQQGMGRDTIYIRKADQQSKSDYDLNFHIDLEYRKATLTERFGNYVITFTQPKTAGSPKKVTMTISGKDYLFREMETSNEGTTMTMRMTHFRVGVPDDIFSFDPNQYPDAVILERVESSTDP